MLLKAKTQVFKGNLAAWNPVPATAGKRFCGPQEGSASAVEGSDNSWKIFLVLYAAPDSFVASRGITSATQSVHNSTKNTDVSQLLARAAPSLGECVGRFPGSPGGLGAAGKTIDTKLVMQGRRP